MAEVLPSLLGALLAVPTVSAGSALAENLEEARLFYASRAREERPQVDWQEVPRGLSDLRAASCGSCHPAIYDEWRLSTHAQAWTDRQFQAEFTKSGNRWLCNNCHTPLLNQMESWAIGLIDDDVERPIYTANQAFDAAFRAEGITCAACHVREGFVEGPTGVGDSAHLTRKSARFLNESICLTCHQAARSFAGKDFICVFETGREWREGPYGAQGHTCQFCHMQPVTRAQSRDSPERPGRRHYWPGAGIYKEESFGPPRDQLGTGLGVEVTAEPAALVLKLINAWAGHLLPTGDPERFILVEVHFLDPEGRPVGDAYRERIGQTWKWWPEPEKVSDNRLAPFEVRQVRVARPAGASGWSVVASSHRISAEAIRYHDLESYPASRVTHRLEGRFKD